MKNVNNVKNNEYVAVSLFSGAGGLDIKFMDYFDVPLAVEIDEKACETYKRNHPFTVVWNRDVADVKGEEIRKIIGKKKVILIGGAPCQSWSEFKLEINGSKKGLQDARGRLIYQYLRIAEELQPEAVVFENVSYMVGPRHLPSFNEFREELAKRTGLRLEYQILNALDFGVAQKRERVIMIGTKQNVTSPFKYLKKIDGPKTLGEALKDCPKSEFFHFKKEHREIMAQIPTGKCWNVLPSEVAYKAMGKDYKGICKDCNNSFTGSLSCPKCRSKNIRNGYGVTSYFRRLSFDQAAPTVCTVSTTKPHGMLAHPTEQRGLSIRESARLQGFPDDYEFAGNIFDIQRQIGNAVAIPMGQAIAEALLTALEAKTEVSCVDRLKAIVTHHKRNLLSELEKDFLRAALKRVRNNEPFPDKYNLYLKEIHQRLT